MTPEVLVVIPARYASTRLPGKPLCAIGGKSLIQRVWEQACKISNATAVVVATDDKRIEAAVTAFGGTAIMTDPHHPSGTDRIAEVARASEASIIANVQGDEPFLDPSSVEVAIQALIDDPTLKVATLCVAINSEESADRNVTNVVRDLSGNALYFSKLPIPHDRNGNSAAIPLFKHLGVYVFRRDYLLHYAGLPPTPLEQAEKLEQLRILEHGEKIRVIETDHDSLGIDSPEDLVRANDYLKGKK